MDVTISIVSYNTKDLLRRCLSSIQEHTANISYEIFVVDNASADGSAAMVQAQFPQVHLIANRENLFFSKAHGQALSKAQGRYCVILNPDLYLEENVFEPLVHFMDQHSEVGSVGPKIVGTDHLPQGSGDRFPDFWYGLFELLLLNTVWKTNPSRSLRIRPNWSRDTTESVDTLGGACILVRTSLFETVGKLDEGFLMYWEEIDWCKRISDAGWKNYFFSEVQVVHHGGASSSLHSKIKRDCIFYGSMLYYYKKHHGAVVYFILNFICRLFTLPVLKMVRKFKN